MIAEVGWLQLNKILVILAPHYRQCKSTLDLGNYIACPGFPDTICHGRIESSRIESLFAMATVISV